MRHRLSYSAAALSSAVKVRKLRTGCESRSDGIEKLERVLLREAIEEPDEGNLVVEPQPIVRPPALADLHEIFAGQDGKRA